MMLSMKTFATCLGRASFAPCRMVAVKRFFTVEIGHKVPVSFMVGEEDPIIKEDSEYPEWVLTLADPLPTKAQLLAKFNDPQFDNKNFTSGEVMRLKRLVTLAQIKEANMLEGK
jgi:hypothetical protein